MARQRRDRVRLGAEPRSGLVDATHDLPAHLRMSGCNAGSGAGQMTALPSPTEIRLRCCKSLLTNGRTNHARFRAFEAISRWCTAAGRVLVTRIGRSASSTSRRDPSSSSSRRHAGDPGPTVPDLPVGASRSPQYETPVGHRSRCVRPGIRTALRAKSTGQSAPDFPVAGSCPSRTSAVSLLPCAPESSA
jgi:hypothetical protein